MVASVYAVGMLRGRRDRYHRLGFLIPFTVAASPRPSRWGSATRWPDGSTTSSRPSSRPSSWCPRPATTCPRRCSATSTRTAASAAASRSRAWRRGSRTRPTGTSTVVQGLDSVPEDERPTLRQVNTVHLAWDVMVGLGTLLFLLSLWYGGSGCSAGDMPQSKWFLRIASACGVLSVITMEAGWVVTEVGRQPWIVYDYMKVEDAATANTGVWITFVAVAAPLPRPRGDDDPRAPRHEPPVPRERRRRSTTTTCRTGQPPPERPSTASRGGAAVSTAAAVVLLIGDRRLRALRRRRLRGRASGTSSPAGRAGRATRARSSTTRSDRCGRPTTCG